MLATVAHDAVPWQIWAVICMIIIVPASSICMKIVGPILHRAATRRRARQDQDRKYNFRWEA